MYRLVHTGVDREGKGLNLQVEFYATVEAAKERADTFATQYRNAGFRPTPAGNLVTETEWRRLAVHDEDHVLVYRPI